MFEQLPVGVCLQHGFYSGYRCPKCGKKGTQLLSAEEVGKLGRVLTAILRHIPEKFGITLDEHGWASINDIVDVLRKKRRYRWVRFIHIYALAITDPKGRYQVKDGKIRATYGHTIEVDLSDLPEVDAEVAYYPAAEEEVDVILHYGLKPTDRKFVHLSAKLEQAISAGRVHVDDPVILKIDLKKAKELGADIRRASPYVYVSKGIPPDCISILGKASEVEEGSKGDSLEAEGEEEA